MISCVLLMSEEILLIPSNRSMSLKMKINFFDFYDIIYCNISRSY